MEDEDDGENNMYFYSELLITINYRLLRGKKLEDIWAVNWKI